MEKKEKFNLGKFFVNYGIINYRNIISYKTY